MSASGPLLAYLAEDARVSVSPFSRLGGLPIAERVLRAARRGGYSQVVVWAPREPHAFERLARNLRCTTSVRVASTAAEWRRLMTEAGHPTVTVVGAGTVVTPSLLRSSSQIPVAELADPHDAQARLTPQITTPGDLKAAERQLRQSIYKPTDGVIARFNRQLSIPISVALMRTPITANQISIALIGLAVLSAWLFSRGTYATGVMAAAISLTASILDGCDGEVARLKFQESALGCWIETFADYFYYIAVFAGVTVGSVRHTGQPVFVALGVLALVGAVFTFLLMTLLRQRITQGRPERFQATAKAHFYGTGRRWAAFVADLAVCGTRSTMPYGIMLFALAGGLPVIVVLCAIGANVYWISLAVELRALLGGTAQPVVPAPAGPQ